MRTFYALLIITTTLCVSSDAALAITSLKEEKFASSNTLLWNQPTPAGESGLVARRSLRAHDADKEDNIAPAEAGHEEERGILPKPAELMKKLDLDDIMEATIVRSIMKGHAPAKTLDKMGVKPSFVTAEGQRAYSKYDKGYQTYRGWVRWVEDNADWLVKELKA
ncbi:hypothetical protein PHYBOEH_005862 [Phytophthora boehmeriae]|uniref:RxLR effector protein n=1 Tax=Phytophthora boehmeriae TaxID=109152 RepID=A0A8T1WQS7_9STRA|nr:hypothetical protein PHYBOEH_005862 [Phytophthora boehmeriae]